jgi:ATP-dependent helicase/nuclease subunit B
MPTAAHLLPDSLSASAYNDLYTCPYRFFALRMLQLRAPNALEPLPSKRDYGVWLHEILSRYHAALQRAKPAPEDRYALMEAISEEVFTGALENQPAALGFHASWRSKSPAYVDWANQREAEGWRFEFGELSQTKSFSYRAGEVTLYGKPDRVDLHADGQRMLLDYKTSHIASLKSKIKKGSDHQLPFYSLLLDPAPMQAAYLALDEDSPKCVDLENFEN